MLKDLLNKEVVVTYEVGYSYSHKKGIVTKIDDNYLMINNDTLIANHKIVKVVIKIKKG